MQNFARAKGLGKWAERIVTEHLLKNEDVKEIVDVSDDEEYRKYGIDILVTMKNDTLYTADIKMDRLIKRTGNIFLETKSSDRSMGNLITTEADFFLYLDPGGSGRLFKFVPKVLRKLFEENPDKVVIKKVKNKNYESEGFCITTEALLLLPGSSVETLAIEWQK